MKSLLFTCLITLFYFNFSFSQDDTDSKRTTKVEVGYLFGGTPSYHYLATYSGPTFSLFHGKELSDRLHLYGGFNFEKLTDRTILPVMIDFDYYNQKGNQFFNFNMGYAFAWSAHSETQTSYNYNGGLAFGAAYGVDLLVKEDWKLKFLFSYNYRDTKLTYQTNPDNIKYEDPSKTHLLSLKTIFAF